MTASAPLTPTNAADFLAGGGEMAALILSTDWSQTPLGPIATWPQSLRTTVSLCLGSNFPINIIWGPEHCQIYNDGYRVVCGDAHPQALGEAYTKTWASAWPAIGAPFDRALEGQTSFLENQRMFLFRNGYLEETFFTFSLSLGDYIVPDLVADAKFIGNLIYDNSSLGNLPVAAAYSLFPIAIMLVYLFVARRLGAFESL